MVCISQFFPQFAVGPIFTYVAPLAFVLMLTIIKEGLDDYGRLRRDATANSQLYTRISLKDNPGNLKYIGVHHSHAASSSHACPFESIPSSQIRVGDILQIERDQRVPADMILLQTSDRGTGTTFIRTDQLDGEIDWKLRLAVPFTQQCPSLFALLRERGIEVRSELPSKDPHSFQGTIAIGGSGAAEPLGVENTMWMNTVLAAGTAIGVVIYTGKDTRAVMNTSTSATKWGLIDVELNAIAKVLFMISLAMSLMMVGMKGWTGPWVTYLARFFILFSSIIPLSLRVNLDMARMFYARQISTHKTEGANSTGEIIVRNTSIAEELGRVGFLLSDKTGTLTQNVMVMRKLHLGTLCFATESFPEISQHLVHQALGATMMPVMSPYNNGIGASTSSPSCVSPVITTGSVLTAINHQTLLSSPAAPNATHAYVRRGRRDMSARVYDLVQALALCHNVTTAGNEDSASLDGTVAYQASSPDEVAIVNWTRSVGLVLVSRNREAMMLRREADGAILTYAIVTLFPFSSEAKRMGIIVRDISTGEIFFFLKGADVAMVPLLAPLRNTDWLQEECDNMAREGLRTLVVARRRLSEEQLAIFLAHYTEASLALSDRAAAKQRVVRQYLETELELLGITGVEDRLQEDVRVTLESLRNAGIRVWMLTGDKVETATSIGISSKLIARGQIVVPVPRLQTIAEAQGLCELMAARPEAAFVIDGAALQLVLSTPQLATKFIAAAANMATLICCRCTPQQKAQVATLLKQHTRLLRVCCIGDGGNDVSMIQAADIGVGLVGREGMQASLAADYSLERFCDLSRLLCRKIFSLLFLVWHGRCAYKRTSKLSQFVIHRGFIISVLQAVFSSLFYFSPIALYQGVLAIGYSTLFTTFPVFSLVLDKDVREDLAMLYPELYKELAKGRALCFRSLFQWILVSLYQGGIIIFTALWLFETDFIHIVAISFSALLFNELLMVALQLNMWNKFMVLSEIFSVLCYVATMRGLRGSFDPLFISSPTFLWKVLLITVLSFLPLLLIKIIRRIVSPPNYTKLS